MKLFKKLLDYGEYLKENLFHQNLEINVEDFSNLDKKIVRETCYCADSNSTIPYYGKFDDLVRLTRVIVW